MLRPFAQGVLLQLAITTLEVLAEQLGSVPIITLLPEVVIRTLAMELTVTLVTTPALLTTPLVRQIILQLLALHLTVEPLPLTFLTVLSAVTVFMRQIVALNVLVTIVMFQATLMNNAYSRQILVLRIPGKILRQAQLPPALVQPSEVILRLVLMVVQIIARHLI